MKCPPQPHDRTPTCSPTPTAHLPWSELWIRMEVWFKRCNSVCLKSWIFSPSILSFRFLTPRIHYIKFLSTLKLELKAAWPGQLSLRPQTLPQLSFHKARLWCVSGSTSAQRSTANIERLWWFIEGSLEVKLPTIWTDEKESWAEAERRGE